MNTPQELCDICKGHEYMEDHFTMAEFIPKDQYLPSMIVPVHKSHFNEVTDKSKEVYRQDGKYIIEYLTS